MATKMKARPKVLAIEIFLRRQDSGDIGATEEADQLEHKRRLQDEADDVDEHADDSEVVQQVNTIKHLIGPSNR